MPLDEPLYPINLRIFGWPCLVVGGGAVAANKIEGLLECDARVHVVATEIGAEVAALVGRVNVVAQRSYRTSDVEGMRLTVAATGDSGVNRQVLADGRSAGVLVNSADDPENCDFTLPSRVRRGPILLTASTQGKSPALAAWLRRKLSAEIGPEYEIVLEVLADVREELRAAGHPTEGLAWQDALDSGILDLVREGNVAQAKERLQACLSSSSE